MPFVVFGFLDNFIMLAAGNSIESSLGTTLGLSTMAAAAIGNIFSDVAGIASGGTVEMYAARIGLPDPKLTLAQLSSPATNMTRLGSSILGIVVGCVLGMIPLLYMDEFKGRAREMFSALDLNGNQRIEKHEMRAALNELAAEQGVRMEDPRIARAVLELCGIACDDDDDDDVEQEPEQEPGQEQGEGSGAGVTFPEFWLVASTIRDFAGAAQNSRVRRLFNAFRADRMGRISRAEVMSAFQTSSGFDMVFSQSVATDGRDTAPLTFDASAVSLAAAVTLDGPGGDSSNSSSEERRIGFKQFRDFCVHCIIFSILRFIIGQLHETRLCSFPFAFRLASGRDSRDSGPS